MAPYLSPTERAVERLPPHLRRFVVPQHYDDYTERDHAVWRHVMAKLTAHLGKTAHASYLDGLAATGIRTDRIPSLDEMNEKLAALGWAAVGVRGFIPPAVFTELQWLGVLAIAADIRSHAHVGYTPAPDIIHEAAGHAPILTNKRYASYLKACGEVGFRAIASIEDEATFEAIRHLSIVKEDPHSSAQTVELAEQRLVAAGACRRYISENTRASRLYWWTAEYGLVGTLEDPKLYGAGLLSSLGESAHCLTPEVKKLPLSLLCADTEYDITRMQPQLFVARDFDHLFEVLDQFAAGLAWKRGGDFGLAEALNSKTVNHVSLAHGVEVTGRVSQVWNGTRTEGKHQDAKVVHLEGPTMLTRAHRSSAGPALVPAVLLRSPVHLPREGAFTLDLPNGLCASGFMGPGQEAVNLRVELDGQHLDLPTRARVVAFEGIPSVAGGPADPATWDETFGRLSSMTEGTGEDEARAAKAAEVPAALTYLYRRVNALRGKAVSGASIAELKDRAQQFPKEWLLHEAIGKLEQEA
jgi:phenylalanine-4-hydroxylase